MHETVIATSLLNIVLDEVNKQEKELDKSLLVNEIQLKVGLLSCIEAQTLKGCFGILAERSKAENADLMIERMPLEGFCKDCQKNVTIIKRHFVCPHCQGTSVDWHGGNEMQIASIKVQEQNPEKEV